MGLVPEKEERENEDTCKDDGGRHVPLSDVEGQRL